MMVEKKKTAKKAAGSRKSAPKSKASAKKSAKAKNSPVAGHTAKVEVGNKMPGEVTRVALRGFRISPRKARLIVELIRGKQVEPALQVLMFSPKKAAVVALKLLRSAVSNAVEQGSADVDKLWVIGGWVHMGTTMKRFMPRAQGRATPIRKRSSHITIVLGEKR